MKDKLFPYFDKKEYKLDAQEGTLMGSFIGENEAGHRKFFDVFMVDMKRIIVADLGDKFDVWVSAKDGIDYEVKNGKVILKGYDKEDK